MHDLSTMRGKQAEAAERELARRAEIRGSVADVDGAGVIRSDGGWRVVVIRRGRVPVGGVGPVRDRGLRDGRPAAE